MRNGEIQVDSLPKETEPCASVTAAFLKVCWDVLTIRCSICPKPWNRRTCRIFFGVFIDLHRAHATDTVYVESDYLQPMQVLTFFLFKAAAYLDKSIQVQVLGILQQVERGCTPKRNILQVRNLEASLALYSGT